MGGKPFLTDEEWFSKGFKSIRDLPNPGGIFLTSGELKARYSIENSS